MHLLFYYRWLDKQVPVIRHIDEDELWNYRYPSHPSIVSKTNFYIFMISVPSIIFIFQLLINRNEKSTIAVVYYAIKGLTLAYCINGIFTAGLKLLVGRPRPNFFLRCFPEGYGTNIDECTGEYEGLMDGRKSFPSGHASFAFTGMIYMMLHLNKNIDLKRPRFARGPLIFAISLLPLSACLIGASRSADYHHHFSGNKLNVVEGYKNVMFCLNSCKNCLKEY